LHENVFIEISDDFFVFPKKCSFVQYMMMGNDTARTITRTKEIVNAASAVSAATFIYLFLVE